MKVIKLGSRSSEVMKAQAVLKKAGYNIRSIDGMFESETRRAVENLQVDNYLFPNGIVESDTSKIFEKLLLGYDNYIIKLGETVYDISEKYNISVNRITAANPNISLSNFKKGQNLIVPLKFDIVDTNVNYTYETMEMDVKGLKIRYPFIETGIAGKSVLGKNLYYIKLGSGPNEVFFNGTHHAREWITSLLLMKFVEDFSKAYVDHADICKYNINDIWSKSTIYVVPMVNPDGADLIINGLQKDNPFYYELIQWNNGEMDFSKDWQANIRGVDLNHNYDAAWHLGKKAETEYGVFGPGPTRYSGQFPESEPEVKAVVDFTRKHNFRLIMAYHSQGEEIYWTYSNIMPKDSRKIAELFSEVSGYSLIEPSGIVSYSGYKDWFMEKYIRPGFTIEVGKGKNPLPLYQFDKIYMDNLEMLILASVL